MPTLHLVPADTSGQVPPLRPRPVWNLPTYSPTSLNQYAACPEAFLHERVLRTPTPPDVGSTALIKGTVVHALLERYVGCDAAARARLAARLADEATQALARQGLAIAIDSAHEQTVTEVIAAVTRGIDVIETEFAQAVAFVGEQFLDLRWDREPAPFRLTAKIDLLAVHPGGIVESIDWKTGATREPDHLQNVICRLVTEANAGRLLGGYLPAGRPAEIRTTVCHLGTRDVTTMVFSHEELRPEFDAIRDQITRIEQAKSDPTPGSLAWRPQPCWRCQFCRFADVCSYHTAAGDDTLGWLDPTPALPV